MQHRTVLHDADTYTTIYQSLDRELHAHVDPYKSADHANLVVFNELNGLTYAVEGIRGKNARDNAAALTHTDHVSGQEGAAAIGAVAPAYAGPVAYYGTLAGFPPPSGQAQTVERLFTGITDTLVRAVVENSACLAQSHGVYVVIGTPLPIVEGASCVGAYAGWVACPGWHKSTSPADIAALQDPDLAPSPYVYVADTPNVDNVELVFAPDGSLYDLQPKVNLTSTELTVVGWNQASASTIHAIPLAGADALRFPQVKMGIGISLDAFEAGTSSTPCPAEAGGQTITNPYPQFMQCLDSLGVNLFLQPEWNAAIPDCMSWTDFAEAGSTGGATPCGAGWSWQPLSWMKSAWQAVQGRNPDGTFTYKNFMYAVNPFIVGHLFDVTGDGQTAIFSRYDPRARSGWYAGDSSASLYASAGLYTDRADSPEFAQYEGPQPGFLALTSWVIPESSPAATYRLTTPPLKPGDPGSLQSCERGLAPDSGVTPALATSQFGTDLCAENNYHSNALIADLDLSAGGAPVPEAPWTAALVGGALLGAALFLLRQPNGGSSG
jgi:predicted amidohydrolase